MNLNAFYSTLCLIFHLTIEHEISKVMSRVQKFALIVDTMDIFFDQLLSEDRCEDSLILNKLVRLYASLEKAKYFHPLEKNTIEKIKGSVQAMIIQIVNCESIKNNQVGRHISIPFLILLSSVALSISLVISNLLMHSIKMIINV